jgi:uncharacterized protein YndB with AHSA1/START domain
MTTTDRGSYLALDDGRDAVRFERVYDHPIDRVWALVTDPAELAHWFPFPKVTVELTRGGAMTFSGDRSMPDAVVAGRVTAIDPPHLFAFDWGGDELRFDLTRLDAARTRLTLTDILEARDAAARNAAGWDLRLAALDDRAAGRPPADHPPTEWKQRYDAYVAAGLPQGATVPGQG